MSHTEPNKTMSDPMQALVKQLLGFRESQLPEEEIKLQVALYIDQYVDAKLAVVEDRLKRLIIG